MEEIKLFNNLVISNKKLKSRVELFFQFTPFAVKKENRTLGNFAILGLLGAGVALRSLQFGSDAHKLLKAVSKTGK